MRESGVRVSEDAPYTLLAQKDRVPDSDSGGRGVRLPQSVPHARVAEQEDALR